MANAIHQPFNGGEIARLERISARVDELWAEHAASLGRLRKRTTDPYGVFGRDAEGENTSLDFKDKALAGELHAEFQKNATAYRRLKLAMDYWCALWFWPMDRHAELPDRDDFLSELESFLLGDIFPTQSQEAQLELLPPTQDKTEGRQFINKFGVVDFDKLFKAFPRLQLAEQLATERHFLHWELEFADIFARRGGFRPDAGQPALD